MGESRSLDLPRLLTWSMFFKLTVLTALLSVVSAADLVFRGLRRYPLPANAPVWAVPGGNPERGEVAVRRYGCAACHTLPDVRSALGQVGPDLEDVGTRMFIAGQLPNTPENLIRWIQEPQEIRPETAMPDLGVTEAEARDIAAYLYSRR